MKFQVNLELLVTVEADNPADAWEKGKKLLPALEGLAEEEFGEFGWQPWSLSDGAHAHVDAIHWDGDGDVNPVIITGPTITREDIIREWEKKRGQDKQETA